MIRAIDAGRAEYAFPWILALGIRLLNMLPRCFQGLFLKGFFFTVVPDAESRLSEGGFHKFGKPVFPLRRQYPKQRREPQHRSDVEAFL